MNDQEHANSVSAALEQLNGAIKDAWGAGLRVDAFIDTTPSARARMFGSGEFEVLQRKMHQVRVTVARELWP